MGQGGGGEWGWGVLVLGFSGQPGWAKKRVLHNRAQVLSQAGRVLPQRKLSVISGKMVATTVAQEATGTSVATLVGSHHRRGVSVGVSTNATADRETSTRGKKEIQFNMT